MYMANGACIYGLQTYTHYRGFPQQDNDNVRGNAPGRLYRRAVVMFSHALWMREEGSETLDTGRQHYQLQGDDIIQQYKLTH